MDRMYELKTEKEMKKEIKEFSLKYMETLLDGSKLSRDEFFLSLFKIGLSKKDFAKLAKVTRQTVCNYGVQTAEHTEIYLSMVLSNYVRIYLKEKEENYPGIA